MASRTGLVASIVVTLALLTSAQQNWGISGALSPGSLGSTPEATELIATLGRNPNATSYVTFNRTDDNMLETWGWRINITDIPVPNNPLFFDEPSANSSEGLHVTNVQWQLHWPGDESESLQSFLAQANSTLYAWNLRASLPSNIASRVNNQTNGNCSAILGDECATSMANAASTGRNAYFTGLNGCANTLDLGNPGGWSFDVGTNTSSPGALYPNGTFSYYTSDTYSGGNDTIFNENKSQLQILTLTFQSNATTRGSSSGTSVVCQIVDSAAPGWVTPTAVMWSMALLSTLLVMWQ